MDEEVTVQKGIDLPLVAPSVHRIMNERMHAAILKAIMSAAEAVGWRFEYTQEAHELSCLARTHIIEAIWPAHAMFTKPRLHLMDPESFDQWARDAIEDGWAANWLDLTLESLQELGIRPVPNIEASQPDS